MFSFRNKRGQEESAGISKIVALIIGVVVLILAVYIVLGFFTNTALPFGKSLPDFGFGKEKVSGIQIFRYDLGAEEGKEVQFFDGINWNILNADSIKVDDRGFVREDMKNAFIGFYGGDAERSGDVGGSAKEVRFIGGPLNLKEESLKNYVRFKVGSDNYIINNNNDVFRSKRGIIFDDSEKGYEKIGDLVETTFNPGEPNLNLQGYKIEIDFDELEGVSEELKVHLKTIHQREIAKYLSPIKGVQYPNTFPSEYGTVQIPVGDKIFTFLTYNGEVLDIILRVAFEGEVEVYKIETGSVEEVGVAPFELYPESNFPLNFESSVLSHVFEWRDVVLDEPMEFPYVKITDENKKEKDLSKLEKSEIEVCVQKDNRFLVVNLKKEVLGDKCHV